MIFYNDKDNRDTSIYEMCDAWNKQPYKIVRPPNFYNYEPNRDKYVAKERNFDAYRSQDWNAKNAAWQTVNMQ